MPPQPEELEVTDPLPDPYMTVQAFLDAFIASDLDKALTYIADDCEYTNIPMGTVRDPAGMREDGEITVWRDYFDLGTAAKIHDPAPD